MEVIVLWHGKRWETFGAGGSRHSQLGGAWLGSSNEMALDPKKLS